MCSVKTGRNGSRGPSLHVARGGADWRGRACALACDAVTDSWPGGAVRQRAHAHTGAGDGLWLRPCAAFGASARGWRGARWFERLHFGWPDAMAQTPINDRDIKFRDGLGLRVVTTDASGDAVEQLRVSTELADSGVVHSRARGTPRQLPPCEVRPAPRRRSAEAGRQGAGRLVRRRGRRPAVDDSRGGVEAAADRRRRRRAADRARSAARHRHPARLAQGDARRDRPRAPRLHDAASPDHPRPRAGPRARHGSISRARSCGSSTASPCPAARAACSTSAPT